MPAVSLGWNILSTLNLLILNLSECIELAVGKRVWHTLPIILSRFHTHQTPPTRVTKDDIDIYYPVLTTDNHPTYIAINYGLFATWVLNRNI